MQPPIADPHHASQNHFEGSEIQEFRFNFWLYFGATWVTFLVGGSLALFGLNALFPARFPLLSAESTSVLLALVSVLLAAMIGYIWRFMPLKVGRWGVRGVNFWTTPCQASWEQMSSVKYVWMLYPYAVVRCGNHPKLWIWLRLENPREFARAVAEFAPPDHPLHAFLCGRGLLTS